MGERHSSSGFERRPLAAIAITRKGKRGTDLGARPPGRTPDFDERR
jgi:hypothetical protein